MMSAGNRDSSPFFTFQGPSTFFEDAMEEIEYSRAATSSCDRSDSIGPSLWLDAMMHGDPLEVSCHDAAAPTDESDMSLFPDFNDVVPVLDAEDQDTHPLPPPPPSIVGHSFPIIVVDVASDPLLITELDHLQAPILRHFCKDLATMVWNSMFHEPVSRQPTAAMCWKFITRACECELTFDPAWSPEEGNILICITVHL